VSPYGFSHLYLSSICAQLTMTFSQAATVFVHASTRMLCSLYSMGRMESIWGEDCLEFKPERWISEQGRIVHVPSYKFIAFNAGPRTCLGKDMSFIQMKIVASSIIWNYRVQVVEGHPVLPKISVVLHMRHGLKVRVTKRDL
jgi:cytochrome P450